MTFLNYLGHIHQFILASVHQSPQIRPMNDIKTIEELRAYSRTIEGGCDGLKTA